MGGTVTDPFCMGNAPFYGLSGGISVFIYDIKYFHSYLSASFSYNLFLSESGDFLSDYQNVWELTKYTIVYILT